MAIPVECERKFLVVGEGWREAAVAAPIRQGYLASDGGCRVRVRRYGDSAFLTIKGPKDKGVGGAAPGRAVGRAEFEYEIPVDHAEYLLTRVCDRRPVEKLRHIVQHGGLRWEVDEFLGPNRGLVVAEVELTSPAQPVALPPWAGREVTGDRRFSNSHLYRRPFQLWAHEVEALMPCPPADRPRHVTGGIPER